MFYELSARAMENEKLSIRVIFPRLLLRITQLVRKQNFTTKLMLEKLMLCVEGHKKCHFCKKNRSKWTPPGSDRDNLVWFDVFRRALSKI